MKSKVRKAAKKVIVPISIFEIRTSDSPFKKFITKEKVLELLKRNKTEDQSIEDMIEFSYKSSFGLYLEKENVTLYGSRPRMS